jgi:hypothetical protein
MSVGLTRPTVWAYSHGSTPGLLQSCLAHGLTVDTESKTFMPPYNISWATFLSTLERMAADPPNRVDRTYLDSQSGTVQTYLIAAYKAFGLISDEARPTDAVNMFAESDLRKDMIADLIKTYYPTMLPLGETNSTSGELAEAFTAAFPTLTGESRVKAIRFFLSAAAYADLKLSPMWKAPKAPRGKSAARRSGRSAKGNQSAVGAASTGAVKPKPQSMEEAKLAYFDLLINNANEGTKLDPGVLDRIELLVGLNGSKGKPARVKSEDRNTAGSKPATPTDPQ